MNGSGVFFDFINDFEKNVGLEFNKIPYLKESNPTTSNYKIRILDNDKELSNKDLLIFVDNYVAIGKEYQRINRISDMKNIIFGVFESDGDDEESEEQEQSENGHEGDDEEENEDEDNKKIKIKKKNKTSTKKKDIIDINEDLEEEQDNQKKTNNILYGILILGLPYETTEIELKNLFSKYGQIVKIYLPK